MEYERQFLSLGITIKFLTPPLIVGNSVDNPFTDGSSVRDHKGRHIIPASSWRGRLRHACRKVARVFGMELCDDPSPGSMCHDKGDLCVVCRLFGSPVQPSALTFKDLVCELGSVSSELRYQITLDRKRRSAKYGSIAFLDTAPTISGLQFSQEAAVSGWCGTTECALFLLALREPFNWGGGRSRGLGWGEVTARGTWGEREIEISPGTPISFDFDWKGALSA